MEDQNYIFPFSIRSSLRSIIVGNGEGLEVMHTGSSSLSDKTSSFSLYSVLHVPSICKNLVSFRQFTHDNCCSVEFYPGVFVLRI